jgi:signal transduction histidine kinase
VRVPPFAQTVRFKLTVWYSSLLLVFGIAFVVALNLAARLNRPDLISLEDLQSGEVQVEFVRTGPGQALWRPTMITFKDAEDKLYTQNLENLRTWSIVAVFGLAVASGVGGYVLSGMMLRPVRDIAQVASEIGASNLNRRINHQGPDDELKALADTFDSMIDRLEHSFDQQRQFVQDASHELRTPLAAIRTNIEVAEMDPEISPEEYRALLDTVKTQTARLTRLSEDLLLLSTSEGETLELEPVGLVDLADDVSAQLGPLAATHSMAIRVEGDESIDAMAGTDQLYRCLFNLVDNAIKYAGDGSTVTIRAERAGDQAVIKVTDNGVGIPQEELQRVFDRFFRVDKGRARRHGGTGLGLAIVRELVLSMGGTVTVESTPGGGTSFTIRLKAAPAWPPVVMKPSAPVLTAG